MNLRDHKADRGGKGMKTCKWKYDKGYSEVANHLSFSTEHGFYVTCYNQRKLEWAFCPYCGKQIEERP